MKTAIFTIVSNNYLHFARTLFQSIKKASWEADLYCVIVDQEQLHAKELSNEFQMVSIDELSLPSHQEFTFKYSVLELNTAVKPWGMEFLLQKGYEEVLYIDPDICVFKQFTEVLEALRDQSDIVLTPHLLAPITDSCRPTELDIRRAGTYNLGFCAVKNTENVINFLNWWKGKLENDCVVDVERGVFVDQSWMDLVPGLFEKVLVLRHAGYNVAYWNISQRLLAQDVGGQWRANGDPLVFLHFSGFNPNNPQPFSKHQNRLTLADLGEAQILVGEYAKKLIDNGVNKYSSLKYGFGYFSDGTKISDLFRRAYLKSESLRLKLGSNPFGGGDHFSELIENNEFGMEITWAMHSLRDARPDLQRAFPLAGHSDVLAYWRWFLDEASSYFGDEIEQRHRDIFKKRLAFSGKYNSASRDLYNPAVERLNHIFLNMLGRPPSAHDKVIYVPQCEGVFSLLKVLVGVSISPESRGRERYLSRIKNTVLALLISTPHVAEMPVINIVSHKYFPSYSGIYPPDVDSNVQGLWCSDRVEIPLPRNSSGDLIIRGSYPPDLHLQANKESKVKLRIVLDGLEVYSENLPSSGEIDLEFADVPQGVKSLTIEVGSTFTPSAIGLNADNRALSWRVLTVRVGELELIEAGKPNPIYPISDLCKPAGVNIVGYVAAELGVGEAARSMARSATSVGLSYSIIDVGHQSTNQQNDRSAWADATADVYDIDVVYVNADQAPRTLDYLRDIKHGVEKFKVGYWHWEQPKLPERYLGSFVGLDEVWVPTSFVQEAISAISPVPVFKVPHAVEFSVNRKIGRSSFGIPENSYAILVMYDFHSYRYRKNPEAAIAAYRMLLNQRHTSLVIKTINADKYVEDYKALKDSVSDLPGVIFLDTVYSREMVYALEACCDCLMSLHRAEGYGLVLAEMMYLGKPVIATGWSGNMEFMNNMNSFPVNYSLQPLENTLGVYESGVNWAEPDVEHAAYFLGKLIDDPGLSSEIGKVAQHTMRSKFSPQVIGRKYVERLSLISARF